MFTNTKAISGFAVDDVAKAQEFYGTTLGLKTTVLQEGLLLQLDIAGDRPTLVYAKPDFEPATYTILNFPVADVERAVADLKDRGIALELYDGMDQDDQGIMRNEGPLIAWFRDPAGNILSVVEQ
jgi:catechol 2,3-dioxygenase-like lactoylglutathione lyase family enzyme